MNHTLVGRVSSSAAPSLCLPDIVSPPQYPAQTIFHRQKRQAPPSCISTSEKYIFKAGGACANLKTMSTNPKRNSDSVANEGGDGVVLYANQRATCSWLWPSPTPSNPTPNRTNGSMCCCYTRLHDPPAIPIISGYFIISGCSHNSDLNDWCVLVHQLEQLRKKKR